MKTQEQVCHDWGCAKINGWQAESIFFGEVLWYSGGYYNGILDTDFRPESFHPKEKLAEWYMGFSDGQGDRELWETFGEPA